MPVSNFVLLSMSSLSICPYSFSPVGQNNCWGSGPSGWASVCFGQRTALFHGCRLPAKKTVKNDGDQLWVDCAHFTISMAQIPLMSVEMWSCTLVFIRACTISSPLKIFFWKAYTSAQVFHSSHSLFGEVLDIRSFNSNPQETAEFTAPSAV